MDQLLIVVGESEEPIIKITCYWRMRICVTKSIGYINCIANIMVILVRSLWIISVYWIFTGKSIAFKGGYFHLSNFNQVVLCVYMQFYGECRKFGRNMTMLFVWVEWDGNGYLVKIMIDLWRRKPTVEDMMGHRIPRP